MKRIQLFTISALLFLLVKSELHAQCSSSGSFFNEQYLTPTGWTLVDDGDGAATIETACGGGANGTIIVGGGAARLITARSGRNLRVHKALPNSLSNFYWTADFTLNFNAAPIWPAPGLATNSPAVTLAAFTAGNAPIRNSCIGGVQCVSCGAGNYNYNIADAVWVTMAGPNPGTCVSNLTQAGHNFVIWAKDGATAVNSIGIPLTGLLTYYLRVQRTGVDWVMLSVYSDAAYTNQIPGSPVCLFINPQTMSVTGLNTLQQGVEPQGNCNRVANVSISNMLIDDYVTCPLSLTAAFTPVTISCTTLTFDASATTGNPFQENSQYWEITECDQFGNPLTGGQTWSQWVGGNAGVYTFPSPSNGGPNFISCGNYYKVKLAVTNCVNPWNETSMVIYLPCPVINSSPDVVNCNPLLQSTPIGNGSNNSSWNYAWSSNNPNVTVGNFNGPTNGATGEGNATITVIVTDQNGCTATDQLEYAGIIADAGPDRKICLKGDDVGTIKPVEIGGSSTAGMTYTWTSDDPSGQILCSGCPKTLVKPSGLVNPVTYTLTVTGANGLSCTDQVMVTIVPSMPGMPINLFLQATYSVDCNLLPWSAIPNSFSGGFAPFSFQWVSTTPNSINNLSATNVINPTFISCNSGSNPAYFYLTVTDANGCQASRVVTVNYVNGPPDPGNGGGTGFVINTPTDKLRPDYMDRTSDIGENKLEFKIELAPNPNTGTFNLIIQSPINSSPSVHLVDLSGRILYSQSISIQEGLNQIEISKPELPSGVYFMKVDGFDEPIKMIITK